MNFQFVYLFFILSICVFFVNSNDVLHRYSVRRTVSGGEFGWGGTSAKR